MDATNPSHHQRREHWELLICVAAAAALVVFRSIVPMAYEQIFDSDQAIVGLMAKHLSEGRAFPLFFYGQNYMLGVQAWIAAPFFWLGGPTVAMLRLPLVFINIAVAIIFILAFARRGVRPIFALVSTLPIIATTPAVSLELLTTLGASIEPFAYVLLLWALRRRPVAFGTLFGIGALHREFTLFVLPALAIAEWRAWRSWSPAALARGAAAFAAVWIIVDVIKNQVNMFGPAGGVHRTGSVILGPATIMNWLSFRWDAYQGRLADLLTRGGADMLGARPGPIVGSGIPDGFTAGSGLAAGVLAAAVVVCAVRLIWLAWRSDRGGRAGGGRFSLYLALIAGQAMLAYGLNDGILVGAPVLRYFLFALLLPMAFFGFYFQRDTTRAWRATVALLVVVWAGSNVRDNARLLYACAVKPAPARHRILADYMVANGIRYGRVGYWDCYVVNFLSRERVILASTDLVRISTYQAMVDRNASEAVTLKRQPCNTGRRVDVWCVSDPDNR